MNIHDGGQDAINNILSSTYDEPSSWKILSVTLTVNNY
jgi:hypothetical protein